MQRKSFVKGVLGVSAVAGLLGTGGRGEAQENAAAGAEKKLAAKNTFLNGWLTAWLTGMKKDLPEAEKVLVIEDNGRACAERGGSLTWARSFQGNLDKLLTEMRTQIGEKNVVRDGNTVRLTYEQCFCPLVGDLPGKLPDDFCLCTRGWTKAVYGAITGKPVDVILKSTIKRGDPACIIEVKL